MGDFYESFDDDAKKVADACNSVLAGRDMGTGQRVPLAGVPYHAVETYLARLIAAGHKVAIVEQTGDEPIKGVMTREVTGIASHHSIHFSSRDLLPGPHQPDLACTEERLAGEEAAL